MSLVVLKRKLQNKHRLNKVNSDTGTSFSLAMTNTGVNKSSCGTNNKVPIVQKSYRNYNKFLLNYKVNPRLRSTTSIHKKMADFPSSSHTSNVSSKAVRCEMGHLGDLCVKPPPIPASCSNDCSSKKTVITKDLGFISSSDYIKRKVARRTTGDYESITYGNTTCSG